MNVFVLCTGRSGSTTFYRACRHITNFTAAHESRKRLLGVARLQYADNHIEVDNRLSWLLGRLDDRYGNEAFYVHLTRDETETARSFHRRWTGRHSIVRAYAEGILSSDDKTEEVCADLCQTVDSNIRHFLRGKSHVLEFHLEQAAEQFRTFWAAIHAEGDLDAALAEFKTQHNASPTPRLSAVPHALAWGLRQRLLRPARRSYWAWR